MRLQPLLSCFHQSPEYMRGLQALRKDQAPVWIEGLAGASKAALTAALQQDVGRLVLFLTATEEVSERLAEDLVAFGLAAHEIGLYPASDADLDRFVPDRQVLASSMTSERKALARTRIGVLEALASHSLKVVVAPIEAALRETFGRVSDYRVLLAARGQVNLSELTRKLSDLGYERAVLVEQPGQFAVRGGLLDVWPSTHVSPVRLELFGDDVESLREFNPETQLSTHEVPEVGILPAREDIAPAESVSRTVTLLEHLPPGSVIVLDEPNHLRSQWLDAHDRERQRRDAADAGDRVLPQHVTSLRSTSIDLSAFLERVQAYRVVLLTLPAQSLPWMRKVQDSAEKIVINSGVVDAVHGDIPRLADRIRGWLGTGSRVAIASDQPHRLVELLVQQEVPTTVVDHCEEEADGSEEGAEPPDLFAHSTSRTSRRGPHPVEVVHGRLSAGFQLPALKIRILTDAEVFGEGGQRRRVRAERQPQKFREGRPIMSLLELKVGDLVVHVSHGIGRYRGLVRRAVNGVQREFLQIDYQEPDRLFVPSDQLDRVQKYIGNTDSPPTVHRLGGAEWQRTKSRVRARVREMAKELIQLYAKRAAAQGYTFAEDTIWQEEMEAAFPYRETRDQLRAIQDTKGDMQRAQPMDRLVCGDVGYGKTEVAIRAAFKAATDGKQVAVLVPTTILAQQHYHTFTERLAAFPVRVELLSRFRSRQELKQAVQGIQDGVVDIAIGTHRLLSKDVQFQDLGLVIVDEEQRFGVAHKERLKQLRASVDVLTLTATPIPRTLHMSLSGIRDMSVIEEPPEGRLSVRTYCMEAEDWVIREAILRELDRGGQVYFVHNRIESIARHAERIHRLAPQARIRVGHGQMKETELEDVMLSFYDGEFDVLVCTTIIESGLDIPNVNTILIHNADFLGLSQLHQLRGRVGRSSRQAYCYLLYQPAKELSETAQQRLDAIREFTDLGAGFNIAMRDMEIRGAGNLLGAEQHGNMISVGFDLYCQMIEEEVKTLKGEAVEETLLPTVILPLSAYVPEDYIPTEGLRIAFYRKMAACRTREDVDRVQAELEDRFGDPPKTVWNVLAILRLRMDCLTAGVARIETEKGSVLLWLSRRMDRDEQRELYRHNKRLQFIPDRIRLFFDGEDPLRPVEEFVKLLQRRGGKAAAAAVQKQLVAAAAAETGSGTRGS